ncbi:MAG: hypothetical protein HON90_16485 [Halobacteriovoraceae bacterium]|jgi:hypothetical protein|nr:hypothetical protein [Halobacteriovoraceae bacterium]
MAMVTERIQDLNIKKKKKVNLAKSVYQNGAKYYEKTTNKKLIVKSAKEVIELITKLNKKQDSKAS